MPTGPGKYDEACSAARESTRALACLLIVLGGTKGSGFSLQAVDRVGRPLLKKLPELLRGIADDIERDVQA